MARRERSSSEVDERGGDADRGGDEESPGGGCVGKDVRRRRGSFSLKSLHAARGGRSGTHAAARTSSKRHESTTRTRFSRRSRATPPEATRRPATEYTRRQTFVSEKPRRAFPRVQQQTLDDSSRFRSSSTRGNPRAFSRRNAPRSVVSLSRRRRRLSLSLTRSSLLHSPPESVRRDDSHARRFSRVTPESPRSYPYASSSSSSSSSSFPRRSRTTGGSASPSVAIIVANRASPNTCDAVTYAFATAP